ncbi:class I SAM-dependent methyltransferase [Rhodococcus sp. X156]|uniref:class I SAM-dependent methyltransferase n=1 Tax=Rhodococcus sp. X156 TaxID=2499145 RepID=UPI0019D2EBE2|nr:class I SAM-dependent methyltransferase [Rhodococcus sp. X156]
MTERQSRHRGATAEGDRNVLVHGAIRREVLRREAGQPCRVLDVGGGSGGWAVPLAELGCDVTVVDPSPDALASLARRARETGATAQVTAVQGDMDCLGELVAPGTADVVLAHGVLEVVEDVPAAMHALVTALAPGGVLSVLVAGRAAAVLHRALAGRLADAARVLTDPDGRFGEHDPLLRRFDLPGLTTLLTSSGLVVELVQGDAALSDLVPSASLEAGSQAAVQLHELDALASGTSPLREIASRLHALARLPLNV